MTPRRAVEWLAAAGFFALLTAAMTWPQALFLGSRATPHQDVYFNMWRLRWFAHAIGTPSAVFDGNIFHPERRTLAYSDAMPVEGLVAARDPRFDHTALDDQSEVPERNRCRGGTVEVR